MNPAHDILAGTANPRLAASLAVLYAELVRAQADHDAEAVRFINRGIRDVMRGVPDGPIDSALLPLQGRKTTKKKP